jgi:hypothetical protein
LPLSASAARAFWPANTTAYSKALPADFMSSLHSPRAL